MAKENKSNIIIYQSEDGQTHIEVQMDEDTVWLSQQQMADLYQTSRTNVVEHIKHIYEDGELVEESTCRKIRHAIIHIKATIVKLIVHFYYKEFYKERAEMEGFEPSHRLPGLPHFECGPFSHLGTSPY